MKYIVVLLLGAWSVQAQITGQVEYHRQMEGDGLLPRDVVVWLPPHYATETNRAYPVLYMHDGENVFDPKTSFLGIDWSVDEVATRLIEEGKIEPIIVVGIYNTPERGPEYGQNPVKTRAYMDFVVHKAKPFIDEHYRTEPGRDNTATMGSSMGGLISFLLAWEHPDVFSMAGCLSPAFVVGDWVQQVEAYDGPSKNIRIYMDNGGKGLDKEKLQPGCDRMLEVLSKKEFTLGYNLEWYLDENAEHNEPAWAARVWRPLTFMFGKK